MTLSGPFRALAPLLGVALLSACGGASDEGDGGILIVPASYREAMNSGGHQKHVGRSEPDGGQILCKSCHLLATEGFASPDVKPCQTCHADRMGFHHGPADGGTLADGGVLSCLSCHAFAVRDGKIASTPWICLDCHAEPVGDRVAVKAHVAACFFCHQPHRTPFTQPTDCNVCHRFTFAHGAKGSTVAETCMKCHDKHAAKEDASRHCVACHSDPKVRRAKETVVTQAALFKGHPSCGTCHVAHRFVRTEVKACLTCHGDQVVLARAFLSTVKNNPKKAAGHARCTDCHNPHLGKQGAPKICSTCHTEIKSTHPPPKDAPLMVCMQCHPMHEALPGQRYVKDCGVCHKEAEFTGLIHAKDKKTGQSLTCSQCHTPHAFTRKLEDKSSCKECHAATVAATVKMKKSGHAKCEDCHQGLPHKPLKDKKACLSCHEKMQPPQKEHDSCVKCHDVHSGARIKSCLECHQLKDLAGLHIEPKHQKCETCHSPHGPQVYGKRITCLTGCHAKQTDHEPKAERCNACHLFRIAKPGDNPAQLKKR